MATNILPGVLQSEEVKSRMKASKFEDTSTIWIRDGCATLGRKVKYRAVSYIDQSGRDITHGPNKQSATRLPSMSFKVHTTLDRRKFQRAIMKK